VGGRQPLRGAGARPVGGARQLSRTGDAAKSGSTVLPPLAGGQPPAQCTAQPQSAKVRGGAKSFHGNPQNRGCRAAASATCGRGRCEGHVRIGEQSPPARPGWDARRPVRRPAHDPVGLLPASRLPKMWPWKPTSAEAHGWVTGVITLLHPVDQLPAGNLTLLPQQDLQRATAPAARASPAGRAGGGKPADHTKQPPTQHSYPASEIPRSGPCSRSFAPIPSSAHTPLTPYFHPTSSEADSVLG